MSKAQFSRLDKAANLYSRVKGEIPPIEWPVFAEDAEEVWIHIWR